MSDPTLADRLEELLKGAEWYSGDGVMVPEVFAIKRGDPPKVIREAVDRIAELEAQIDRSQSALMDYEEREGHR